MAVLTITIGALSNTKSISNTDITRVLNAAKRGYGQVNDNGVLRDRTNQELLDLIAAEFHRKLDEMARQSETSAATEAITPISIT